MNNDKKAQIFYHDIGDYLSREEKLRILKEAKSFANLPLQTLQPNEHGDWISQRNDVFDTFITIGNKDDNKINSFFNPIYSRGLASARDAWCYNSSKFEITKNLQDLIKYYNQQRILFFDKQKESPNLKLDDFLDFDTNKITWNRGLKNDFSKNKAIIFDNNNIKLSLYRPFFKQNTYLSREINDMIYLLPKIFPNSNTNNIVICLPGIGNTKDFGLTITNLIPDLGLISACQAFPLYYYEERQKQNANLFDEGGEKEYVRRDGISDFILERAKKQYGKNVGKEDIFYYVYGFLHCPAYREMFANDLKKMLPRLPLVEEVRDFWKFSKAGRELADLHIHYESVSAYEGVSVKGAESGFYTVEKMRFPKKDQKDTIIYNSKISVANIPAEAYDYVVNGKSAIEWIMERYAVSTHKESGIKNDPNDWATEVGNPRYILDLLLSVIHLSVKTVEIVETLPKVRFE